MLIISSSKMRIVSSKLVGATFIRFKLFVRDGLFCEIFKNFCSSIVRINLTAPVSRICSILFEMSMVPADSSKNTCALSKQRIMFLARLASINIRRIKVSKLDLLDAADINLEASRTYT